MNKTAVTGAVLASAVGLMFLDHPVMAQESSGSSQQAKVKCLAANDCKGKGSCKSAQNDAADRRHTTPRVALILPQTSEEIVLWNDSAAQNRNVMPTWLRANPSRS